MLGGLEQYFSRSGNHVGRWLCSFGDFLRRVGEFGGLLRRCGENGGGATASPKRVCVIS